MKPIAGNTARLWPLDLGDWRWRYPVVVLFMLAIGTMMPVITRGQEVVDDSRTQAAHAIREALGYDVKSLAVLGLSSESHDALIAAVASYVRNADASLMGQLASLRQAKRELIYAAGTDAKFDAATADKQKRALRISSACGALEQELQALLAPEQQQSHARLLENRNLGPSLGLVSDLSDEQRKQLAAALNRRDRTLLYPRNWHRHGTRRQARQRCQVSIKQILNSQQWTEYQQICDQIEVNLPNVMDRELSSEPLSQAEESTDGQEPGLKYAFTQFAREYYRVAIDAFRHWIIPRVQQLGMHIPPDSDTKTHTSLKVSVPGGIGDGRAVSMARGS